MLASKPNETAFDINEAELIAEKIRKAYCKKNNFPIDPITIGRELGIKIIDVKLPHNVSGAILKKKNQDPIIMLPNNEFENRKRFSCAHEIGHYIFRLQRNRLEEAIDFVDNTDDLYKTEHNEDELSANRFAKALLMPKDDIKKLHKKYDGYYLASYFGVSIDKINSRCDELGLKLW